VGSAGGNVVGVGRLQPLCGGVAGYLMHRAEAVWERSQRTMNPTQMEKGKKPGKEFK